MTGDNVVAKENAEDMFILKGYSAVTVPYNWLSEDRPIWTFTYKDNVATPHKLINNLLDLYRVDTEEVNLENLVNSRIPLMISSDKNKPPIHLTCNVAVFKCHRISKTTPLQFLLSFESPFVIHNYLPYHLEVRGRSEHFNEKQLGVAKSQEAFETYAIDGRNFRSTRLIWKVHVNDNTHYYCESWSAMLKTNEVSEHKLNFSINTRDRGGSNQDKLELYGSIRPNLNLSNNYCNFALREKVYESCSSNKIVIYGKYAIVNKTDEDIIFSSKNRHEQMIGAHNSCLFSLFEKNELKFKVKGYGKVLID